MKSPSPRKERVLQWTRFNALRAGTVCGVGIGLIWLAATARLVAAPHGEADSRIWINFEAEEGYLDGDGLGEFDEWWVSEAAAGVVTAEERYHGAQGLKIIGDGVPVGAKYSTEGLPQQGVRFIEVSIQPVPLEGEELPIFLNLWGAEFEFFRGDDRSIHLDLLGEGGGAPPSASFSFPVDEDAEERTEPWLNMVVRQDLETAKWDLFLNGELVGADLALGEYRESMEIEVGQEEAVYLDGVGIGTENPLFPDSDGDGMPDAYEIAHGLNPHLNDRNGDKDGDGIRNISEYQAGTSPNVAGSGLAAQVIYVDNSVGSDSNSGQLPNGAANDGPKFSIKAAMEAAQNGAVIVVLPGTGIYNEGSRSAKGKRITIRTVQPIVIK